MASICYISCSIPHYKNHHDRCKKFEIGRPLHSSQSASKKLITAKVVRTVEPVPRRSANYAPSLWSFDDIQSISSEYKGEDYNARADTLKDGVRMIIRKAGGPLRTLELIDDLQRLGISYHFEDEIRNLLDVIYNNYFKTHDKWNTMDF
ncbi:putative R-linalool synthase [Helianthus debilis subsp. tardiflorus]